MNAAEGTALKDIDGIQQKAKARMVEALGGSTSDIELSALPDLELNGCHFLRATHRARPGTQPGKFAVLPDQRVVDSFAKDGASAEVILRACGAQAPATWWASIVTSFGGVGGVLVDGEHAPSAIRKIRQAGEEFAPPALVATGADRTITFYVMNYEEELPYKVQARLPKGGGFEVTRTAMRPDSK